MAISGQENDILKRELDSVQTRENTMKELYNEARFALIREITEHGQILVRNTKDDFSRGFLVCAILTTSAHFSPNFVFICLYLLIDNYVIWHYYDIQYRRLGYLWTDIYICINRKVLFSISVAVYSLLYLFYTLLMFF